MPSCHNDITQDTQIPLQEVFLTFYEVHYGICEASMHGMDLLWAHLCHEKRETSLPTVLGKGKSENN